MMRRIGHIAGIVTIALALAGPFARAANSDKALVDTESRRRAAENGVREIKSKSPADTSRAATAYATAAVKNNAWLDAVCQAIQNGAATVPDLKPAADDAAAALVEWVVVRNGALGVTAILDGTAATGVKTSVSRDLQSITASMWKDTRRFDDVKRVKLTATFKERLQWKTWEEIH